MKQKTKKIFACIVNGAIIGAAWASPTDSIYGPLCLVAGSVMFAMAVEGTWAEPKLIRGKYV